MRYGLRRLLLCYCVVGLCMSSQAYGTALNLYITAQLHAIARAKGNATLRGNSNVKSVIPTNAVILYEARGCPKVIHAISRASATR